MEQKEQEEKEQPQVQEEKTQETKENKANENIKYDIKKLRKEISSLNDKDFLKFIEKNKQSDTYLAALQRNQADFENYQKRMEREKATYMKYASESLLRKLLNIIDLLSRAINSATANDDTKGIAEGIILTQKELIKILKDAGVTAIDTTNAKFNYNIHEAISMIQNPALEDMTIVQELEKGYMLYDRLLRASKVIVNKLPARPKETPKQPENQHEHNKQHEHENHNQHEHNK
jgi:molecular chaperone GrpE